MNESFKWTEEMQEAFEGLKKKVKTPLVPAFPNFDYPFVFETTASSVAFGFVLAQKKGDGRVHLIQFASRTMTGQQCWDFSREREAPGVVFALKNFPVYLLSEKPFVIYTYHQGLQAAFKKKDIHRLLVRWLNLIAKHIFEIGFRPGPSKGGADYLSRRLIEKTKI